MTPIQLADETPRAFDAFKAYCADPKRSIRRCARMLRKSPTIIARWSKKHRWQKRIRELALQDCQREISASEQAMARVAEELERERARFRQRAITASRKATERALQILKQPLKGSRPAEAARLLCAADMVGRAALGVGSMDFGLRPTFQPVIHVTLHRDAMSDEAQRHQEEFFKRHPELKRPKNGLSESLSLREQMKS
jgi:hypothetical protein